MGTIPNRVLVAEKRDRDGLSFVEIATSLNVSRQAVHKAYRKFCEEHGVDWRTRNLTPKTTSDAQ